MTLAGGLSTKGTKQVNPSSIPGRIIHEVREVVVEPEEFLPRARAYVVFDDNECMELAWHSPYVETLELHPCSKEEWYGESILSPVSAWCSGKAVVDIIRSELFGSIGLLLEDAGQRCALHLDGCPIDGLRANLNYIDSTYYEPGDLFSWLSGEPIFLPKRMENEEAAEE